ncbi:MAG TPA: protein kinase [Planctomycetota bacterium]|nr:protein kinase [Planctomycetota bacterium]HRR79080.1 protein kinase [Planctomycetota bacterium]HRT93030.1 protein kinase [Planctomycetota bacterium]
MPSARDEEFIRFAVASGYLTEDQAGQALATLREIEALGGSAAAPDVLLKRGLLDERQVALVHQAIAASKVATKVPRELGSFELLEKIGQGGMGSVFKARQKELGRLVALKVLSPRLARNADFVAAFLREARSAGRLSHPNIVSAIDVGESQGFYYFAMEYAEGDTLAKLIAREGPLPEARALQIATDVARALDHAHQKGLIHRDIKPDNILVTPDGRVRVTDFGLAKAIGQGAPDGTDDERFLGTPAYVAPEQIRSEPGIDCRADIFSLGVTLFQMLTGELPFKGANPMAIAAAVVAEPLPPIRSLRPDVSAATARVVEKMTAKNPAQRYATPAEVVAALESAAAAPRPPAPKPIAHKHVAPRRHASHTATHMAVAGVLLVLIALAFVVLRSQRRRPPGGQGSAQESNSSLVVSPPPATGTPAVDTSRRAAADRLLRDLLRAVELAGKFEEQNPRDLLGLASKLQNILDEFPPARRAELPREGLDLLEQTETRLQRVQEQADKAASADLQDRIPRGTALLEEGKINEALALLDAFPASLRTRAAAARLLELQAQWRERALALFDARDAQGKDLIEKGQLDEAKALYGAFASCVVLQIASRAKEALTAIDEVHSKRLVEARRAARATYVKEARTILDQLAAHQFREARTQVDAAAVNPALASVREEVKDLQHLVRTVTEVWTTAGIGLRKLKPGEKIRLGGIGGDVVEADEEKLVMKVSERLTIARRLSDLRPADVLEFALRGYGAAGAQTEAKLALFLLAERDYEGARKRLAAARAGGADVARETALLDRFSPRDCATCKGAKSISCPDCDGKGIARVERQDCDQCGGKGGGRCGFCHGTGFLRCANCNGTGRGPLGLPCNECGGNGRVRCSKCKGDGHLECSKCKGTGTLATTTPCARCKGAKNITCPDCGGKGTLPPPDLTLPTTAPAP